MAVPMPRPSASSKPIPQCTGFETFCRNNLSSMAVGVPTEAPPLTERSAADLAAAIRAGDLRAREVVEAHIAAIERLNPSLNAIVATRFDSARSEADAADAMVAAASDRSELPPLLGVPCTIKESLAVAGMPNSAGLHHRRNLRATANATAVQRLFDAGAICLGVTNVSELTLWIESTNRIYGRTNNAYASGRTAGGSSGGEGAGVASGFAPLGLGTDFGGSIRIPAFFNGVFGHKPSRGLVPNSGAFPAPRDEIGARMLAIGPITRRAADLWPVVRTIAGPDGSDSTVEPFELGDPGRGRDRGTSGEHLRRSDDLAGLARAPQRAGSGRAGARGTRRPGAAGPPAWVAARDRALPGDGPPVRQPRGAARAGGL